MILRDFLYRLDKEDECSTDGAHFSMTQVLSDSLPETAVIVVLVTEPPEEQTAEMRWFRRHDSDNNDPRLLSLSPLRGSDQTAPSPSPSSTLVGGTSTTETGWSFNRYPSTTCPTAPPTPAGNARLDRSSTVAASAYPAHLPCTLKRKPAVRRRSGGKG